MPVFPYNLLLAPAILWVILFFVGRHQGNTSFSTLFYVSLGVSIISVLAFVYVPEFAIIITPVVCVLAIQKFCYIGWLRSIIATILYIVGCMAWNFFFDKLIHT